MLSIVLWDRADLHCKLKCPNCRKIEKGQWLYGNGCRPLPEFNMDDWAHDDDLYGLSYSEMVKLMNNTYS
ncbi:unnamed protein product [Ilex paraguariensis]|uniref:Uncharacterized protein n=1 Tax=Ilex paraguariensis TaxID=185542 RepID=A0ABC8SSU4_9AQUA